MSLPPPDSYAEYKERVRCLCVLYGCSVTGGGRTPARNSTVGGSLASKHQWTYGGWGDDLVPDENTNTRRDEVIAAAKRLGLWATAHNVGSGMHVHLQGKAPGSHPARGG